MIVDCFPFFDELDLIEIRFEELAGVVDRFVVAESPVSHLGLPKPLYFRDNASRFRRFAGKVEHLVVEPPQTDDQWVREGFQRDALKRAVKDLPPNALVFISDADEIFRPSAMLDAASRARFAFLEMDLYLCFMNLRRKQPKWLKAFCAPAQDILVMDLSLPRWKEHAYLQEKNLPEDSIVTNAGWHFSWLPGVEGVVKKLQITPHTEMRPWLERLDEIKASLAKGETFFLTGESLERAELADLPEAVGKHYRSLNKAGYFWHPPGWYRRLIGR
jgi:hypothetical protein